MLMTIEITNQNRSQLRINDCVTTPVGQAYITDIEFDVVDVVIAGSSRKNPMTDFVDIADITEVMIDADYRGDFKAFAAAANARILRLTVRMGTVLSVSFPSFSPRRKPGILASQRLGVNINPGPSSRIPDSRTVATG